ncbi:hypothetical protein ColTof4_13298 [Colletotrichum tofieldiae]|uniref:Transcription factor Iwr1 domain-containing protein n=1 Tax=Colletotrichum tofieldiae TaxID=708197 RepID=A0A166S2C8_9PEZI|nr:hypothetical protein CT0861_00499 [Colletotrichum tofieldiae]GKT53286.1 hypothetical protein ColTof3_00625 [Colletotrichum tofieldiae]GKT80875.1 hypothetical protein ColTof4_13298 [Colletotrichum tofieldiae]GKT88295.1 hypothetical protein Ct61P_06145 [Colletotrichum tofieldiae]
MSAPPQLIHIKRKRGDEDAPVTYLQLEPGSKRHLAGGSWVYQRRLAKASARSAAAAQHAAAHAKPIIQTSKPGDEISSPHRPPISNTPSASSSHVPPIANVANAALGAQAPTPANTAGSQRPTNPSVEPRRFHMSRSAMSSPSGSTILKAGGVTKRGRYGTAVFVERGKKKSARRALDKLDTDKKSAALASADLEVKEEDKPAPKKPLAKRPPRSAAPNVDADRKPMPSVAPTQDLNKIAADMDQWVLHEIGLNLKAMEHPPAPPAAASPSRFKPKAPAKRFAERHPELAKELDGGGDDEEMAEASGGEESSDDDYVIEVYELAPSEPLLAEIPPEEIGVLRFDTQEDMELFYGNEDDDSDYDDEEDENAENHYTADYPEDEVDSEDEYDRHAYLFRNANASDDEEFDLRDQVEDEDEDMYVMEGDEKRDEDDVFQDKIRRYIRQHGAH